MRLIRSTATVVALWITLTACGGAKPTLLPPPTMAGGDPASRSPVYIEATELLIMESFPIQVALRVEGQLPTPCHVLQSEVRPGEAVGQIEVELYSLAPSAGDCIQVLEPFTETIQLGAYQDGSYTVWLNGEVVGEFDA